MSDIPDWLVELAAQSSEDETTDEVIPADEPEAPSMPEGLDFLDVSDDDMSAFASKSVAPAGDPDAYDQVADADTTVVIPESETELMDTLRSQVAVEDVDAGVADAATGRALNLRVPGLQPWQQLVLAVLLFLDVVVIGLLFLVMLGRITLG